MIYLKRIAHSRHGLKLTKGKIYPAEDFNKHGYTSIQMNDGAYFNVLMSLLNENWAEVHEENLLKCGYETTSFKVGNFYEYSIDGPYYQVTDEGGFPHKISNNSRRSLFGHILSSEAKPTTSSPTRTQIQETPMNSQTVVLDPAQRVETFTFVCGSNINNISKAEAFNLLKACEEELFEFDDAAIASKTTYALEQKANIDKAIKKLVKILNY